MILFHLVQDRSRNAGSCPVPGLDEMDLDDTILCPNDGPVDIQDQAEM